MITAAPCSGRGHRSSRKRTGKRGRKRRGTNTERKKKRRRKRERRASANTRKRKERKRRRQRKARWGRWRSARSGPAANANGAPKSRSQRERRSADPTSRPAEPTGQPGLSAPGWSGFAAAVRRRISVALRLPRRSDDAEAFRHRRRADLCFPNRPRGVDELGYAAGFAYARHVRIQLRAGLQPGPD